MSISQVAYLYSVVTAIAVLFQFALAAGAPWGKLAMGGRFPGKFPPVMRVAAVVQAAVLGLLALIVLVRAGVVLPTWHAFSTTAIWVVVAINGISLVMNLITPSKWERILWAPVAVVMTACSVLVALG